MIQISKDEAKLIRKKMPNARLKRTIHKYYAEERPAIMKILERPIQNKGDKKCL